MENKQNKRFACAGKDKRLSDNEALNEIVKELKKQNGGRRR